MESDEVLRPELSPSPHYSAEGISVLVISDDENETLECESSAVESCSKHEEETNDARNGSQKSSSKSITSTFEVKDDYDDDASYDKKEEHPTSVEQDDDENDGPSPVDQDEACLNGPLLPLDEISKVELLDLKGPIISVVEDDEGNNEADVEIVTNLEFAIVPYSVSIVLFSFCLSMGWEYSRKDLSSRCSLPVHHIVQHDEILQPVLPIYDNQQVISHQPRMLFFCFDSNPGLHVLKRWLYASQLLHLTVCLHHV